ncbi:MAG: Glycerol-3-phosphate acyltransferase [bacterium ADurb.Bin363]|nr:MAG: Glycerol-3-phosphate acyltransferase [bacterium ADurb.Bin363]
MSYLLGSLPFGLWAGFVWGGIDVRKYGSCNIGATNVMRVVGVVPGIIVLLCDAVKGLIPVLLAKRFFEIPFLPSGLPEVLVCMAVIIGHNYSIFLKFKGGKGVATSLGVFIALDYRMAIAGVLLFIFLVYVTRYVSVGSMLGMFCGPLMVILFYRGSPRFYSYLVFTIFALISVIYSHRANIRRLLDGSEKRFGEKSPVSKETDHSEKEKMNA